MISCLSSVFAIGETFALPETPMKPEDSRGRLLIDDAEHFFLAHDEKLFAADFDFGPGILAEEHTVASLDVEREDLAVVVGLAFPGRDDFAFLGLFFSAIRDDDSTRNNGFALFDATDEDTVVEWGKCGSCGC